MSTVIAITHDLPDEEVDAVDDDCLSPITTIKIAADSVELLRPQDIERVIDAAAYIGESHLADVHKLIRKGTVVQRAALDAVMVDIAPLLDDITLPYLKAQCDRAARQSRRAVIRQEIQAQYGDDLCGLQLSNGSKTLFVVLLPDASEEGMYRLTNFTEHGFTGHSTHASYQATLDDAIQSGYHNMANGSLEAFATLESFSAGNEYAGRIQQLNSGRISWEAFTKGGAR